MDGPDHGCADWTADSGRGGSTGGGDEGRGIAVSVLTARPSSAWGHATLAEAALAEPALAEAAMRREPLAGGIVLFAANNAKH